MLYLLEKSSFYQFFIQLTKRKSCYFSSKNNTLLFIEKSVKSVSKKKEKIGNCKIKAIFSWTEKVNDFLF